MKDYLSSYRGALPHFVDYRDWLDATPEQRKAWNCALDLVFNRSLPQPEPLPTYPY